MKRTLALSAMLVLSISLPALAETNVQQDGKRYAISLDESIRAHFSVPKLAGARSPKVEVNEVGEGWTHVLATWDVKKPLQQDELSFEFKLDFEPDFWWAPHLTPEDGDSIAQHVFRSPALIAAQEGKTLVIVPDLAICGESEANPWFMDYDAREDTLWLGMSKSRVRAHVLFKKQPGMQFEPGKVSLGFYVLAFNDEATPHDPWAPVTRFLWERFATPLYKQGQPLTVPLDRYIEHTYDWAFNHWRDAVWQEFEIGNTQVGAPAFIVNITESPNYPGEPNLREFMSIWNQAWFSSMRSASGLMRYAKRTGNQELAKKARLSKELALSAPMTDGLFPSVYRTEMERTEIDGKKYSRSKGWDTGYWTNSNRRPSTQGVDENWIHILDASWTGYLMLQWHADIEEDQRLVDYATAYADRLMTLQDSDGFFPAWFDPMTNQPSPVLDDSPETSMSVTFLLKLAEITEKSTYLNAALKAMDAVIKDVIPGGRWEDFETYWSCSSFARTDHQGKRLARNDMYKQNTFSMYWTAQALLASWKATNDDRYLNWGRRTLNELSMAQQVWQPPFIPIAALGGFGVMNADGEWNDARQSLFAEIYLDYYRVLGDPHLFQRGVAALKASYVMMYCPENPELKELWEKKWSHFGPEDYGFMMENFGHGGKADKNGEGIGSFTIYDWGNGAAAEARNRIRDHYGDVYIDRENRRVFGLDSIDAVWEGDSVVLRDLADTSRNIQVTFENGDTKEVRLEEKLVLRIDQ